MEALSIVDVSRNFGSFNALSGVSIEAEQGEFLTLLGPSGCGKSTLLAIIAGLDRPSSGKILIGGTDVSSTLARDRDIAMIFQSYALYPNMTVRKNIEFGLKMRGVAKAERAAAVDRVAGMLRISHLLERRPSQLSGGQRQRVAMGRALVRNPRLFLFDEPLSNLDAQLRSEMRIEIKRLHQRLGATIVYVTHDQVEAMTMSTKVVVMNGGQVVQCGTPADIYERPSDLFVARFVGSPAMNLLAGTLERVGGGVGLRLGTTVIPLPDMPGLSAGRRITLGIRPEAVILDASAPADAVTIDAVADVVEPTGADLLVIFTVDGVEITGRFGPATPISGGQRVRLHVSPSSFHLFDTETGSRIEVPRTPVPEMALSRRA